MSFFHSLSGVVAVLRKITSKTSLFWKLIGIIFLAYLFLSLWNASNEIFYVEKLGVVMKVNKITGKTHAFMQGEWVRLNK